MGHGLVGSNKKVIDFKVNKINHYFIRHTKIGLKSPEFTTFKTEKSKLLAVIKDPEFF